MNRSANCAARVSICSRSACLLDGDVEEGARVAEWRRSCSSQVLVGACEEFHKQPRFISFKDNPPQAELTARTDDSDAGPGRCHAMPIRRRGDAGRRSAACDLIRAPRRWPQLADRQRFAGRRGRSAGRHRRPAQADDRGAKCSWFERQPARPVRRRDRQDAVEHRHFTRLDGQPSPRSPGPPPIA